MRREALWDRLYLSGIDSRAAELARENGLGLEIAAFCYAPNLEDPAVPPSARIWRSLTASGSTPPLRSWPPAPSTRWCGR